MLFEEFLRGPIALMTFACLTTPALAWDCGKLPSRSGTVGYCIELTDRSRNPDILYYFHGAVPSFVTEPEKRWSMLDLQQLEWDELGLPRPTIVTLSWGDHWILKQDKLVSLETEIIPAIESGIPRREGAQRMILGQSMGGLNAFLAWAQLPHLFDAAAFQCPAFTQLSPFTSRLRQYRLAQERSHFLKFQKTIFKLFASVFRPLFSSTEEWLSLQPPEVMARLAGRKLPPAYLVHNIDDQFGFDGAPAIRAAGYEIKTELLDGGHCADVATAGLVSFLSKRHRALSAEPPRP